MRVVFHCYGGTHASPVAAAIYLRKLDESRRPSLRDLMQLELFDEVESRDFGRLIPVGRGDRGDDVYVLGCGRHPQIVLQALKGFTKLLGGDPDEWLMADVRPHINWVMRVGGFASRSLHLVALGRPLVGLGTLLAYPKLVKLARDTRRRLEERVSGRS